MPEPEPSPTTAGVRKSQKAVILKVSTLPGQIERKLDKHTRLKVLMLLTVAVGERGAHGQKSDSAFARTVLRHTPEKNPHWDVKERLGAAIKCN